MNIRKFYESFSDDKVEELISYFTNSHLSDMDGMSMRFDKDKYKVIIFFDLKQLKTEHSGLYDGKNCPSFSSVDDMVRIINDMDSKKEFFQELYSILNDIDNSITTKHTWFLTEVKKLEKYKLEIYL